MDKTDKKVALRQMFRKYFGRMLTVRGITEMALLVAMAVLLDQRFTKISFGAGQSISLTMLPLFIIALRFPLFDSFIGIGIIYGFITMLTDGYGITTYPLDYLLAYGSIAVAAFFQPLIFKKYKAIIFNYIFVVLSVIPAIILRIWWSSVSSMVFWDYTFGAAILYNAPTMLSSAALVAFMLILLYPTLLMFQHTVQNSTTYSNENKDEE